MQIEITMNYHLIPIRLLLLKKWRDNRYWQKRREKGTLCTVGRKVNDWLDLGFPGDPAIKNPLASAGDTGLIPGLGGSLGEGNGYPIPYSCLGNPMDRGAWWATVHGSQRVENDWVTDQHLFTNSKIAFK